MAMVKLNVFYWHIVDSQSFPLCLSSEPELAVLAQKGAYKDKWTYKEDEVKEVVRYAGERGVDVVLEIDTPGHTDIIALVRRGSIPIVSHPCTSG